MNQIYLDNAATTFPKPKEVTQAVSDCLGNYAANPKRGNNPLVKKANQQLQEARSMLANHLGCCTDQVVFVPSATFGLNQIIKGLPLSQGDCIYISPFEHNSVARSVEALRKLSGVEVIVLPFDTSCNLDLHETKRRFESRPPKLVAVSHASNVTGDIVPIKQVIDITHEYGGKVLIDGSQTVGTHTPRLTDFDYDYLAFSSHKGLYGMPGSGCLLIKEQGNILKPLIYGGTGSQSEELDMPTHLPERFESGTHALPSIISMRAGINWIESTGNGVIRNHVADLCRQFLNGLQEIPGLRVIGRKSPEGNIGLVSFVADWIAPQEISVALDNAGISIRAGLHCAPMAHSKFGTITQGTVRVSPSFFNTHDDIDKLLDFLMLL